MKDRLHLGCMFLCVLVVGCSRTRVPLRNGFLAPELESSRPANASLPVVLSLPSRDVMEGMPTPRVALAESETEHKTGPHRHTRTPSHPGAPQQAMNLQPEVSAIGQLSTGDDEGAATNRLTMQITRMETALNQMHRTLTRQQQRTVAQIREFLKEARQALTTGDMDGAGTLVNKAGILLREMNP